MNNNIGQKAYSFLLINGSLHYKFKILLESILNPYGNLHVINEVEAIKMVSNNKFELIIIDATIIKNATVLARRIRMVQPAVAIIIATASPTWSRAREAFRAGATNYIEKSTDKEKLQFEILNTLFNVYPILRENMEEGFLSC